MSKTYLPCDPDQQLLLPAALQEWLPDNHLAYFISDVVNRISASVRNRMPRACRSLFPATTWYSPHCSRTIRTLCAHSPP